MAKIYKWLLGFVASVLIVVVGLAIIMLLAQLAFSNMNFWIVVVICIIPLSLAVYKIIDYALVVIPYRVLKNRTISLYIVLSLQIVLFATSNLFNINSSNQFTSVPSWFWMTVNVMLILGTMISVKPVSKGLKKIGMLDQIS